VTAAPERSIGESRWWPALALVVFVSLNIGIRLWLGGQAAVRVPWLLPGIEIVLLVALVTAGPESVARHARWAHRVALSLVVLLVLAALWSTVLLVYDLIKGIGVTQEPSELLATGALVWIGNNLAFALLYWLMDGGGPIVRVRLEMPVDFAFTQHMSPELAPPDWRPQYVDYLILGLTTSTAFSPTDVMPMTAWAKLTMALQSLVSLTVVGLVIARAVNVFS
jgi:uncharacterized membrane protein